MSSIIPLIDFWKLKRKYNGQACIIKPHHKMIANALTKVLAGTLPTKNLMILMPPRTTKTDLGVKAFVCDALSLYPDSEFIIAGCASDLAVANSVDIRQTLTSEWYQSMVGSDWGCHILANRDKTGRQDYFHTLESGSVKAVGVGGTIIGFGAGKLRDEFGGAIIIDDPIKEQDSRSPVMRKACIDWYHGTLETRKNNDKTPVILIMQRLHLDDLAGHLLSTERDDWTVLELPAYDDVTDTSIWEERISRDSLMKMKEADPDKYWSQYQQNPSESAANIFKREWWKFWSSLSRVEQRITLKIITADTAFKAKDACDWSVLQCWGFENTSGLYLIDQHKGKWEFPELITNATEFWGKHHNPQSGATPATEFWVEDKASGTSLVQVFRRDGKIPAKAWEPNDKTSPDKVGRAKASTMPISAGRVLLPNPKMEGYRWVDGFINEHSAFTVDDSHLHDDQVDGHTMANLIWQQRGGGRGPLPILETL